MVLARCAGCNRSQCGVMARNTSGLLTRFTCMSPSSLSLTRTRAIVSVCSPAVLVGSSVAYLIMVKLLWSWMSTRKEFACKEVMIVYNISQIVLCAYMTYGITALMFKEAPLWEPIPGDCHTRTHTHTHTHARTHARTHAHTHTHTHTHTRSSHLISSHLISFVHSVNALFTSSHHSVRMT
jgi:hypothetical protein